MNSEEIKKSRVDNIRIYMGQQQNYIFNMVNNKSSYMGRRLNEYFAIDLQHVPQLMGHYANIITKKV